ncbi:MAG TPA: GDYXXLXY domain-containing protein [Fluviicoccus sp.]|nr:GDYXXLXY domain-containing protein [Fluviicoccus sp.]
MKRRVLMAAAGVLVMGLVNHAILEKERQLRDGVRVLLPLAPVDPRSLMQGDYMSLRYELERELMQALPKESRQTDDGFLLVRVDEHCVASLRQRLRERPNALPAGMLALQYRVRHGQLKLASNAFFFEEGKGAVYQPARFGEFRVNESGGLLLTGLYDAEYRRLGR